MTNSTETRGEKPPQERWTVGSALVTIGALLFGVWVASLFLAGPLWQLLLPGVPWPSWLLGAVLAAAAICFFGGMIYSSERDE